MLVYSQYINIRARRFRSKIKRHKTERKLISLFFIFQPSEVLVFTITTHKLCANIGIRSVTFKTKNAKYESCLPFYRTRVRSLVMLVTHSLTNWLTHSLPLSKLDWCEPGMWRWQLKTCWSLLGTNSLPNWLSHWLLFSKLDWCDPGMWRWQLKTCC